MNPARLTLIASICQRSARPGLPERVKERLQTGHRTRTQTQETVDLARTDDSVLDEEISLDVISPLLARATGGEYEGHARTDLLLTRTEREQAASDLWHYRHPPAMWLAPVSLFAPVARLTA